MMKFIIATAVVLIAAIIIISVLFYFGFIDFYHPIKGAEENQIRVACVGDSITFGCTVQNWQKKQLSDCA